MRFWKSVGSLVMIAVLSFVFVPRVSASERDQKTIVTFSGPVEIPGKVLTPGTYTFKVLDVAGTRDVVQVLDKNEMHVYATFIALPATINKPSEKPFISFAERPAGSPPAIEAWFYPGRTDGPCQITWHRTSLICRNPRHNPLTMTRTNLLSLP